MFWGIFKRVATLEQQVETIMSTEADLENALKKAAADFAAHVAADATTFKSLKDAITALQAQVASLTASQPVTQEQLDALTQSAADLDAAINAAPTS